MIHAKDIMIGDWVKFPGGAIDKVVDMPYIEGKGICASFAASATLFPFPISKIEPIPITPEILEKNGFKEEQLPIGIRKMIWESEDTRTEIVLYMDDTMPMEIRKNIYYEDEICYTLPFVWVVHELQHALRLCGIEKEIEL